MWPCGLPLIIDQTGDIQIPSCRVLPRSRQRGRSFGVHADKHPGQAPACFRINALKQAAGNAAGAMSELATLALSVPIMLSLGAAVRVWDGGSSMTGEMSERTGAFRTRDVLAYAMLIGAAMAAAPAKDAAVRATGLAMAISILPPIVNAGVLMMDASRAAGPTQERQASTGYSGVKTCVPRQLLLRLESNTVDRSRRVCGVLCTGREVSW